jgi:hypothetical protein
MPLEFEQLTSAVAELAREAGQRRDRQQEELHNALQLLRQFATSWEFIDERLDWAVSNADMKFYRSARPLFHELPLDGGISPPAPPEQATLIATDGSQIVPDRHAPFLYYLINVSAVTYYHGSGRAPETATFPRLAFPRGPELEEDDAFNLSGNLVSMRRDLAEIVTLLAKVAEAVNEPGPTLGILDQRLLYWPVSSSPGRHEERIVEEWQEAMSAIRAQGGWLAGFIDRPGKSSVMTMLHTLDLDNTGRQRQVSDLYRGNSDLFAGLTDTNLFDAVLRPRERSVIFVDISQHNSKFASREPDNEVCFFYLKTGPGDGQLARVDVPIWVARDKAALGAVHALLVDQCRILGDYPYVITRADEIAVVGRRDQEELESRIALRLAGQDIHAESTAKQRSKDLARGGKTRFEG